MKRYIPTIMFVFLMSLFCYAQDNKVEKIGDNWVYETSFQELMKKKITEEIQIQNNATVNLNHVSLTVRINGKEHKMQTIPGIKSGSKEEFDGYEDDEMHDEFPHYFGKDGKFSKKNKNKITFIVDFKEHREDVIISDVYMTDENLLFIVEDNPHKKIKSEEESLQEAGAKTIILEGKKYLLFEGQAYPVN